jgi:hypothetical protein
VRCAAPRRAAPRPPRPAARRWWSADACSSGPTRTATTRSRTSPTSRCSGSASSSRSCRWAAGGGQRAGSSSQLPLRPARLQPGSCLAAASESLQCLHMPGSAGAVRPACAGPATTCPTTPRPSPPPPPCRAMLSPAWSGCTTCARSRLWRWWSAPAAAARRPRSRRRPRRLRLRRPAPAPAQRRQSRPAQRRPAQRRPRWAAPAGSAAGASGGPLGPAACRPAPSSLLLPAPASQDCTAARTAPRAPRPHASRTLPPPPHTHTACCRARLLQVQEEYNELRKKLIGLTDVTREYFAKLVAQLEAGFDRMGEVRAGLAAARRRMPRLAAGGSGPLLQRRMGHWGSWGRLHEALPRGPSRRLHWPSCGGARLLQPSGGRAAVAATACGAACGAAPAGGRRPNAAPTRPNPLAPCRRTQQSSQARAASRPSSRSSRSRSSRLQPRLRRLARAPRAPSARAAGSGGAAVGAAAATLRWTRCWRSRGSGRAAFAPWPTRTWARWRAACARSRGGREGRCWWGVGGCRRGRRLTSAVGAAIAPLAAQGGRSGRGHCLWERAAGSAAATAALLQDVTGTLCAAE